VVPSLIQQSANTTVMLGSGQTLAIAGLLENQSSQTDASVPGLGSVPVLGSAFRQDNFSRSQDELVILVTPYLVTARSNPAAFRLPGESWSPPTLVQRFFLDKQSGGAYRPIILPSGVGMELK
jgi:pilus assembly protein CpaC